MHYLGHMISSCGVAHNSEKVQAILDWSKSRSFTVLHGFFGLSDFYRKFVCHYITLVAPLTDILGSTNFSWSIEATHAFTTLKKQMTSLPILVLPNFFELFVLETDASTMVVGVVLS